MVHLFSGLIAAWPLVVKRGLAHWRLLSSIVIGVLMASAIMSGTVIYFDALRELALKNTLSKLTANETNILVGAERGPTSYDEYEKVSSTVNRQFNARVAWFLEERISGGKSQTFFLTLPGLEDLAGDDNARAYFAFIDDLREHITLLPGEGTSKERPFNASGGPLELEAIIPRETAQLFGVGVGDRLSAIPHWEDATPFASVVISGIFERKAPQEEYWHVNDTLFEFSTSALFRTAPFYISKQTFMEVLGRAFQDLDSSYVWLLPVDTGRLNPDNAFQALSDIRIMRSRLSTSLFGYRQITSLEDALADYDQRLFFAKLPMFVVLILIAFVILYYVVTLSSLFVEQQRAEIALLRSRGASSAQILSVSALEGATIAIVAIVVSPILASVVISLLGLTPAFAELSEGDTLKVGISGGAYMMSTLGGVLSFAALMIPAVQASRIGVVRHRQQAARPSTEPFFQRYYLDVMLMVVSLILFRQLTEQGSVVATGLFGKTAVNQILLAVPALMLGASALVLLRLFPLSVRFLSGDSPGLLHLVVAGTALILAPSVVLKQVLSEGGPEWLGQVASVTALAGIYFATSRTSDRRLRVAGMGLQAALVASTIVLGPTLPLHLVFVPILIAMVPAQVAFIFLRAFAQRAPVGFSMGMWQMARNPTHYARLSLLLMLAAGLGIFAASFGGTLERSFEQRAFYATGADIRLEGVTLNFRGPTRPLVESYKSMAGVGQVSPAFRGFGVELSKFFGETYTMFAVDGEAFGDVAWFRDDFSRQPMDQLLKSVASPTLPQGIELPEGARTIGVRLKPDKPQPSVAVSMRLRDANNRYVSPCMGTLDSNDWLEFESNVVTHGCRRRSPSRLEPVHPLTLVSLSVHQLIGGSRLSAGSVSIDEIWVRTKDNRIQAIETFEDTEEWSVLRVVPESVTDSLQLSSSAFDGDTGNARFTWSDGSGLVDRGIYHGPDLVPLPVLVSNQFLMNTEHKLGDDLEVSVASHRLHVRLAEAIDYFPTLDTINKSYLIADLNSLSRYANLESAVRELMPNEVWLSKAANGHDPEKLIQRLNDNEPFSTRTVHNREETLADFQSDPLVVAGWRALLFLAFSAVLILSGLGFLAHAYVSFRNREVQFALMRTLGFSLKQLITLVWVEQALVIGAGMALGTWMGGRLGAIIMPFLGHDDRGSQVLPPFIIEVNWGALVMIYVAMALVFAVIILGVVWFINKISLQRVLRLGEM